MKILAVIPTRGGSKGIPGKNVRLLGNKPLIYYMISKSLKSDYITDVVVGSDDEKILEYAHRYKANNVRLPDEITDGKNPLDVPVDYIVNAFEREKHTSYDYIITLQATSPLLKVGTIDAFISEYINQGIDSMLTVIDDRHLSWKKDGDTFVPNYEKRLNRQLLPPVFKETGGAFITKREFITTKSRFGYSVSVYEVPVEESIDIDTNLDWWVCEKLLNKKLIMLRVDGYKEIGLGHIYRALLLASRLIEHDVIFVTDNNRCLGKKILKDSNFKVLTINNHSEFLSILKEYNPDVLINDILNTSVDYMQDVTSLVEKVVNFEDIGNGARLANYVINALYDGNRKMANAYCGKNYYCLKDEFIEMDEYHVNKSVETILITFGGTDPNNYTKRIIGILKNIIGKPVKINVILGLGYSMKQDLESYVQTLDMNIDIFTNVSFISKYMHQADLIFTSQGRTVFEVASIGVPTIVLAQNERETKHTFASLKNGFINLGLGCDCDDQVICDNTCRIIDDFTFRKDLSRLQQENKLSKGIDNVINLITK